ncbi:MAG: NADH-quinone oxidoreductase subunit A [Oligoflexia bacterium]|nr:NADH-quinone oxidoreductase subunit A [Oligoflexia bacterium]
MSEQLVPVLVLTAVVIVFAAAMIGLTFLAGPKRKPTPEKQLPYECGIVGKEHETTRFPVKFYLTAILFILFDIEVIFLYPWALVYGDLLKFGPFILVEIIVFMLVLTFGLFYVWKARALEWD